MLYRNVTVFSMGAHAFTDNRLTHSARGVLAMLNYMADTGLVFLGPGKLPGDPKEGLEAWALLESCGYIREVAPDIWDISGEPMQGGGE